VSILEATTIGLELLIGVVFDSAVLGSFEQPSNNEAASRLMRCLDRVFMVGSRGFKQAF
jgi:hypothetical protein